MNEGALRTATIPSHVSVVVHATPAAVSQAALREFARVLLHEARPLVSFATGSTFAQFYAAIAATDASVRTALDTLRATHLDEFLGFGPDRRGGMVHELFARCPPLRGLQARGDFFAVPASGTPAAIAAHEARLAQAGGIALQFLGIGRNGHVAFNEPGTSFELGFHRARLAASTRQDARGRFDDAEPPTEAVTAGPRSILAARRIVLLAHGSAKAPAVRAMLCGPIDPSCPASIVRQHHDAVVLLDTAAAAELDFDSLGNACN